jgi:pimeloyl-ACP methyl ester carboxylesterase
VRTVATKRIGLSTPVGNAVELAWLEVDGPGRAFVLLHGLTGHRDDFRNVLPALGDDNDVRWIAPDLRGHGDFTRTGREESFTLPGLVQDLVALTDALAIERFDLLGHSFGGMVALRFALAHPERVASLVLMSTAPFAPEGYDRVLFEKAGAIARARGMAFLQARVEQAGRADPAPGPADRQARQRGEAYWLHQRRRYAAMDPVAYGALGLAMVEQEPVVDRLGDIRCPTTILVGDDDLEFLPGADALEAGIAHAHRVTLRDAGHHPHEENTPDWLAAMRAHLDRR